MRIGGRAWSAAAAAAAALAGSAAAWGQEPERAGPPGSPAPMIGGPQVRAVPGRELLMPADIETEAPVAGVCDLTFDVAASGRVRGSTIVAKCSAPDLAAAAIETAARWRYDPKIVDGVAQEQTGVVAKVTFRAPP